MSGVAQQTSEMKPRQLRDADDEVRGIGCVGINSAAVKSNVHLHKHVDLPLRCFHHLGPACCDLRVVDDERDARVLEQREYAIAVDGVERVGETDILHASFNEHFSLAKLGAADADRTLGDLALRQHDALMGFCVWTQTESAGDRRGLHTLQILRHPRVIDEHAWRTKVGELHRASLREVPNGA